MFWIHLLLPIFKSLPCLIFRNVGLPVHFPRLGSSVILIAIQFIFQKVFIFSFLTLHFLYIYIFSSLFISICTFFFLVNCKNICNELKIYFSQTFTVQSFSIEWFVSYVSCKIINWTQLWNKISNVSHLKYHKILSLTNVFLMCFHVYQCCFTSNASLTWWCISLYPL